MVAAFTETQIQRLHVTGQLYRSKLMVRTEQPKKETGCTRHAGDESLGQDDNCSVRGGSDRWMVTADECNRPFAHLDGDYFRKWVAVLAVNVDGAFVENPIEVRNGR